MLGFLLVATLASLAVSLVLAARLLRLAARTRELPELVMGLAFLLAGVIGYSLMLVGNPESGQISAERARPLFVSGYALISAGVVCTYVFIWACFRRGSRWGWWLMLAGSVGALVTAVPLADYRTGGSIQETFYWFGQLVRVGSGVWGMTEAFGYWVRMRRRLRIGLADGLVTNRFLLWGIANATTFAIFLSTSVPAESSAALMTPGRILFISTLTLVTAIAQWLAFLPPDFYRARFAQPA